MISFQKKTRNNVFIILVQMKQSKTISIPVILRIYEILLQLLTLKMYKVTNTLQLTPVLWLRDNTSLLKLLYFL